MNGIEKTSAAGSSSFAIGNPSLSAPAGTFAATLYAVQHKGRELDDIFNRAAQEYNLPPELLRAVAFHESGFQANAVSPAGAMGLMQLMPVTVQAMGVTNPFDPEQNVMAGAKLLEQYLEKYDGDLKLALAAYGAGSGAVSRHGGVPPYAETQKFVEDIMSVVRSGGIPDWDNAGQPSATQLLAAQNAGSSAALLRATVTVRELPVEADFAVAADEPEPSSNPLAGVTLATPAEAVSLSAARAAAETGATQDRLLPSRANPEQAIDPTQTVAPDQNPAALLSAQEQARGETADSISTSETQTADDLLRVDAAEQAQTGEQSSRQTQQPNLPERGESTPAATAEETAVPLLAREMAATQVEADAPTLEQRSLSERMERESTHVAETTPTLSERSLGERMSAVTTGRPDAPFRKRDTFTEQDYEAFVAALPEEEERLLPKKEPPLFYLG